MHGGRKCGPQWGDRWVVDALAMAKVDRAEGTAMVTEYQQGSPFLGVVGRTVEESFTADQLPVPAQGGDQHKGAPAREA